MFISLLNYLYGAMYSKQEASIIKKEFWTSFGQYMRPILNADGEAINWINYKTGVKNIFFRMDADRTDASIAIEFHHPDPEVRSEYYNRFLQLKPMLEETLGEEWYWETAATDEYGKIFSRIIKRLDNVSVFKKEDWPSIISFFKPRILSLDNFWSLVKDSFQ